MLYDGEIFEREGQQFQVRFPYDEDSDPPWERSDGHGSVSEWRPGGRRDAFSKKAGERVLCTDRSSAVFYDYAEAMRIAKRDGWGLSPGDLANLACRLRRTPTQGQICAEAVERDFEFLRRWCNDDWCYVGVVVELLNGEGFGTGEGSSIWGIESDATDYLQETAFELADDIQRLELERTRWRMGQWYGTVGGTVMLRLDGEDVITSHGARIPILDAQRLWPVIQRTVRGDRDYDVGMLVGRSRLTRIRRDGSIVVGCHDIPYAEIRHIAGCLNLLEEVAA